MTPASLNQLLRNSTLALSLLVTTNAWSGGLFLSEFATTESEGTAGVGGITNNYTAEASITNPAGLTGIKTDQLQLGVQIVDLRLEFESTSPTTGTANGSSTSLVPAIFYARRYNDDIVLAVGFQASAGLGFDFSQDWAGKYFINDAEISFINLTSSIAYKVNEKLSLGFTLAVQQFSLEANTTAAPLLPAGPDRKLEIEGDDVNLGYGVGLMYQFTDATRVGFTYKPKIEHDLDMDINITANNPPIIGPGVLAGSFVFEASKPARFAFGVSHQLDQQWRLMARLAYEKWSEFGKISVKSGAGNFNVDLNMEDIYDIGIAAEHNTSGRRMYFGVSYAESIFSDENRIIALPSDESLKLGIGAEWALGNDRFFGLAYELAMFGDAKVNQTNSSGTLKGQAGDYYIQFLSATYRY